MKLGIFIPGRLNSERLNKKLLLPIGNTSIWEIACKKLSLLPEKYNKYVLCFDTELVQIAEKYDLNIIIRDKETTETDGPLSFIFKNLKKVEDSHLMFLNPCPIFLKIDTIISSIKTFNNSNSDYATSVKPLQNWIFDNNSEPMVDIDYNRLSTKEIEPVWEAAHCFHIFNKENFFKTGKMLKPGHLLIPVPKEETIDIDTIYDYQFACWKYELQEE
jgi:CMP-N-acetylneuraminic acid synthetase